MNVYCERSEEYRFTNDYEARKCGEGRYERIL